MDMNLSKLQEMVKDREAWYAAHGVAKSQTQLNNELFKAPNLNPLWTGHVVLITSVPPF